VLTEQLGLVTARSLIADNLGNPPGSVADSSSDTIIDSPKNAVGNYCVGRQWLTCCSRFRVKQGSDCRVTTQPVEAAAAGRSYAPDRHAQPGTDLGVRHWRVGNKQGEQSLAAGGKAGERLPQCGVALGREQFVVGCLGEPVWNALEVVHLLGCRVPTVGALDPEALTPGGGAEPATQRGRLAEAIQMVHQPHPGGLKDIFGVGLV